MANNPYLLKSVKFFRGMEGHGYNANLYHGKRKVAFAYDDARGGCVYIEWDKKEDELNFDKFLEEYPKYKCTIDGTLVSHDESTFLGDLIEIYEIERIVKCLMKKATFYNPPTNEFRSFKKSSGMWNDAKLKVVEEKYPKAIIFNQLSKEQAIELYKKHETLK